MGPKIVLPRFGAPGYQQRRIAAKPRIGLADTPLGLEAETMRRGQGGRLPIPTPAEFQQAVIDESEIVACSGLRQGLLAVMKRRAAVQRALGVRIMIG
jgi:hypothetical protein